MRTVLVVANETLGGQQLFDRAREEAAKGPIRIILCVPRGVTRQQLYNVIITDSGTGMVHSPTIQ